MALPPPRIAKAPVAEAWTCPSCNAIVPTAFCPACGERPVGPPDLTFRGLLAQFTKAISGIDGRLIRSFWTLLTRPGALTNAYVQGRRKPYIGPFQLFLIANVAFFAVQSLTRTKVFSSTLDSHLHRQDWSDLAQQLVSQRLEATHRTLDRYAPLFDQAVVLNSKSLVILMVVPFALLLPIVFLRSRRPFATHVVFSLHLYAFLLLLFCVALAVAAVDVLLGGAGLDSARMDNVLTVINLLACAMYLYAATGPVYAESGAATRVLKACGLALAVGAIVLGYRFLIFLFTLYAI
jgi:Protein of unknown function (DUF3667)